MWAPNIKRLILLQAGGNSLATSTEINRFLTGHAFLSAIHVVLHLTQLEMDKERATIELLALREEVINFDHVIYPSGLNVNVNRDYFKGVVIER